MTRSQDKFDDPRITAYALGELDGVEKEVFERALQSDSDLRARVEATRETVTALTRAIDQEDRMLDRQPPGNVTLPERPAPTSRKSRRWTLWLSGGGLVAALFVAIVSANVAWRGQFDSLARTAARNPSARQGQSDVQPAPGIADVREGLPASSNSSTAAEFRSRVRSSARRPPPQSATRTFFFDRRANGIPAQSPRRPGRLVLQEWEFSSEEQPSIQTDQGRGPGRAGDRFDRIYENPFIRVQTDPLSTFSIDVDTASYAKVRQYLLEQQQLPRPDAVRIEELINYFDYAYESPPGSDPFVANIEVGACPWRNEHRLVRIGLKGKEYPVDDRPAANLVFLLDVSGSMNRPNKLPLVKRAMRRLVDQLNDDDQIAIVVYPGAAGLVLPSTECSEKATIMGSLQRLKSGGSTNGGQGIRLAYQTAQDAFIEGGINRVILCTDGDFNVGTTATDELVRMAEENAKTGVFLSVFGFGMGNHNDAMLEQISNKGDGNYGFIDNDLEAKKVFCEQAAGTLITIAKDVKIQVEFNPAQVAGYRLIGYENRLLQHQDFKDDTKDAGEIGAGHTVTALYEIVPVGAESDALSRSVDPLKYQGRNERASQPSDELLTVKLRFKQPDGNTSRLLSFSATDAGKSWKENSNDFRWAATVAAYGMLLRDSEHRGDATWSDVVQWATSALDKRVSSYREEFLMLARRARSLAGE